jgi:TfoX/Sxy family transcriptional regulator of competence genes
MGSFPVSQNTLGFWLLQADGTPLVMVYYHGPAQWQDTEWNIDSQFTNTAVGAVAL